jgi:hypothetical protein
MIAFLLANPVDDAAQQFGEFGKQLRDQAKLEKRGDGLLAALL